MELDRLDAREFGGRGDGEGVDVFLVRRVPGTDGGVVAVFADFGGSGHFAGHGGLGRGRILWLMAWGRWVAGGHGSVLGTHYFTPHINFCRWRGDRESLPSEVCGMKEER